MHMHMQTHKHTHSHMHACTHTHTRMHMHTHKHTLTHSHTLTHTHTRACTHTRNKFSFFYSLLQQLVNSRLVAIFSRHGATPLTPSLLGPMRHELYDRTSTLAQFIDRSGIVVTLPPDLRVSFKRVIHLIMSSDKLIVVTLPPDLRVSY